MKYSTDKYTKGCGCRSAGECSCNSFAWMKALEACVKDFSKQMMSKLIQGALKGKSGWDDPNWTIEEMEKALIEHVGKGDPVDVANFAMFMWNAQGGQQVPKLDVTKEQNR